MSRDLFSSSKATSSTNSLACSAALSTSSSADAPFVEGEADLEMEDAGARDEPGDDGGSEADMDEETKALESPPVLVTLKLANKEGRVRYSLGAGDQSALPADSPLNLVAGEGGEVECGEMGLFDCVASAREDYKSLLAGDLYESFASSLIQHPAPLPQSPSQSGRGRAPRLSTRTHGRRRPGTRRWRRPRPRRGGRRSR